MSGPSPIVAILQTLAIPVAIMAFAGFKVSHKLDAVAEAFVACALTEQVGLLAIVFALIFGAVSTSHLPMLIGGSSGSTPAVTGSSSFLAIASGGASASSVNYPIEQMTALTTDKEKFMCLYPMLRDELLLEMREKNEMNDEAVGWCKAMMDYNVPGGKLNRGTTVMAVLRALRSEQQLNQVDLARAAVCGWAIEFLQAFFLVADDVMDDSQTRRGQPCWYKLPNIKMIAINDSFLLESFVFGILRKHFANEPYYHDLVDLMLDVIQKTEFGQLLDLTTAEGDKVELERFTLEKYKLIVKYKTAFYSFYLPVAMGMLISGVRDKSAYTLASKICCIMGEYFQIQDDYLDCFGDPKTIGKIGKDIQDNKCSWLVVQALNKCTNEQRQILEKNYGQNDEKKVEKIKSLYRELELPKLFEQYEEESYSAIQKELDEIKIVPRAVFEILLKKIYKRSK